MNEMSKKRMMMMMMMIIMMKMMKKKNTRKKKLKKTKKRIMRADIPKVTPVEVPSSGAMSQGRTLCSGLNKRYYKHFLSF